MVRAMFLTKVKMGATLIVALLAATSGIGWLAMRGFAQDKPARAEDDKPSNPKSAAKPAEAGEAMVEVVFAKEEIRPYVPLTESMFGVRQVPSKFAEGWLNKQDLNGFLKEQKMLKVSLHKNKPLTIDDLYDPFKDALRGVLKVGDVAKTITIDPAKSEGTRFFEPGCLVDIQATTMVSTPDGQKSLSEIIIQNVEILATNNNVGPGIPPAPTERITVRLTREQALLLGSYQQSASLAFLLRPQNDLKNYEAKPQTRANSAERLVNLLQQLLRERRTDPQIVEALYLATQMRLPAEGEAKKAVDRISAAANRERAFDELLQSLVKSK
jgi:Flp pilus assembly protein CpaB